MLASCSRPRDFYIIDYSPIMRSFAQLLVIATAITGALAQYYDGYETVNSATDPVQIRLAYQGPTAMMGK